MDSDYSGVENLNLQNESDFNYFTFICKTLPDEDRQQLKKIAKQCGIFSNELIGCAHYLIIKQTKEFDIENLNLKNNTHFEYFRLICKLLHKEDRQQLIEITRQFGIFSQELRTKAKQLITIQNMRNLFFKKTLGPDVNYIEFYTQLNSSK